MVSMQSRILFNCKEKKTMGLYGFRIDYNVKVIQMQKYKYYMFSLICSFYLKIFRCKCNCFTPKQLSLHQMQTISESYVQTQCRYQQIVACSLQQINLYRRSCIYFSWIRQGTQIVKARISGTLLLNSQYLNDCINKTWTMIISIDTLLWKVENFMEPHEQTMNYGRLILHGKGELTSHRDEPFYWLSNADQSALKPYTNKNRHRLNRIYYIFVHTHIQIHVQMQVTKLIIENESLSLEQGIMGGIGGRIHEQLKGRH